MQTSAEWENGLASGSNSVISTYSCIQHMQLLGQNSFMGIGYSYRYKRKLGEISVKAVVNSVVGSLRLV